MTRTAAVLAGLLVLAVSGASAQTPAPTKLRVAIVPGVAVNLDAARVDALAQDMAEALSSELIVDAIGGLEVRRRLPANGLPPDCVATPACVEDVARRLDVPQLLFVVMVDTGGAGSIQVDSTWVEPATGKSVSRSAIDIAVISESKARFAGAARQLLPDAPVRPKSKVVGVDGEMSKEIPRHFTLASYATAGIGLVGLGLGIGFGMRTRGLYDDCDKPDAPCSEGREDKIRANALIADLGFVAAIGGAVATTILYMTSGSESRLVVNPNPEGGAGVMYLGRF
jgi:hypothetical protein